MAAVRALLHEAKVYIGIARVGDPDHRLHAIALSPFIGHLPVAPLNELPTRLLKFICAALAVDPQAFSKLCRVNEWRPVQVEVTRHSQLLAVTWELLRPSTRLTTYYCD